jgi:hypothetical protein
VQEEQVEEEGVQEEQVEEEEGVQEEQVEGESVQEESVQEEGVQEEQVLPGMMVPVHAGGRHFHAARPPVVLKHKFTLIQNNISNLHLISGVLHRIKYKFEPSIYIFLQCYISGGGFVLHFAANLTAIWSDVILIDCKASSWPQLDGPVYGEDSHFRFHYVTMVISHGGSFGPA